LTFRTISHNRRAEIKSLYVVIIAIITLVCVSCTSPKVPTSVQAPVPAPIPSSPLVSSSSSQPPQTPTTGKWIADGVISSGEYTKARTFGDYELRWTTDEQNIYVAMKAKTIGFVAFAVQPGSRMKDADIILGFVKDGKTEVYDLFSTSDFGPHPPDIELGGVNNLLEFGGKEESGYTTIEFKRALDTGDRYDRALVKGSNIIIWSYGSSDSLTVKHINRGYGELELP
jgi:hypothetical protein